jgi:hypothetical protein
VVREQHGVLHFDDGNGGPVGAKRGGQSRAGSLWVGEGYLPPFGELGSEGLEDREEGDGGGEGVWMGLLTLISYGAVYSGAELSAR